MRNAQGISGRTCGKTKVSESKMVQGPGDHEAEAEAALEDVGGSEDSNIQVPCAVPTVQGMELR